MRRASLACCGLLLLGLLAPAAAVAAAEPLTCPLAPNPPQNADELWAELQAGNHVFVDGEVDFTALRALRRATFDRQRPPVSILSCVDSRVLPEVTFDRTIGELFVARVAGNTFEAVDLAGLEFAVANGWTSVIVVMGHSDCGAIKAALATTDPPTPALKALVARLREGIGNLRTDKPTAEELKAATLNNVRYVASQLETSPLLKACIDAHRLTIFRAYYDGWTGEVVRLDQPEVAAAAEKPPGAGAKLTGSRQSIGVWIACRNCVGKVIPLWDAWNNCVEEDYTREQDFKTADLISLSVTTKCPFEESRMHWRIKRTDVADDQHADVELHVPALGDKTAECGGRAGLSCRLNVFNLMVGEGK